MGLGPPPSFFNKLLVESPNAKFRWNYFESLWSTPCLEK